MSKVQINVGKNDDNEKDLMQSARKYTNVKLHNFSETIAEYLMRHSWRWASLLIGNIKDVQCEQLLNILAPSIRSFEFYVENILPSKDSMTTIDFPVLDSMTFRWTTKKIFEPFLGANNKNLKNVTIELSKRNCHGIVQQFLLSNTTIINLSIRLCNEDYNDLFSEDFSGDLRVKLQTLSFYWRNVSYVDEEKIENWKRFLMTQKDCLKRLVFECTFDCKLVLEMIINEMNSLEHLTFVDLDDEALLTSEKTNFDLQQNLSIKQIDVCVNWFISDEMFQDIVRASPNLEILYLFELTSKTMKFLARHAQNLRRLIYEEIDDDCEKLYDEMCRSRDEDVNINIEISWDQDFEQEFPELHQKMQFT